MSESIGVYISVPFCRAKCTFCNFASGVFGEEKMERYVQGLCSEIRSAKVESQKIRAELPRTVDTIYFGGGTPSLLSANNFREIFASLHGEFGVSRGAEITLECAPGQVFNETLDELLRQGVNRISFGVQSFVDREAAAVGRLHTREQCEADIARVRSQGITDINLDLIAGLPHQTESSWHHSVETAIACGVPHMSVYMLEVDDESRLGREMLAQGTRYSADAVPSEDEAAAFYQYACQRLGDAGIAQYEISNFARCGHDSRHNLKYWRRDPYLGFGLDAHSMLRTSEGATRFANTSDLEKYLGDAGSTPFRLLSRYETAVREIDSVGREQGFEESLFLGLRLSEGVDLNHLRMQFGDGLLQRTMPSLLEVRDAGLLEFDLQRVRLTPQGRLVSNEVFSRLLIDAVA